MSTGSLTRIFVIAIATLAFKSAFAASATASFNVSVQVLAACSISASNMNFGGITTGTTNTTDATSSLTINCPNGTPYTIALSNGANYSSSRRMAWGASHIAYDLYLDNARTTQWTSGSTMTGTGSGADQTLTVFGRIHAGQSISYTGSYSDTIVATITY
jgi:spore coat protein U-like protein